MARHATRTEVIQINDLLREHLDVIRPASGDEPGLVKYKDGWDDKRIASVVSSTLSPNSVGNLRTELFGTLRMPGQQNASQEEVDRLTKLVAALQENNSKQNLAIIEWQERFNRLVYSLHMKQVADVKHLCFVRQDGSVPGVAAVKKATG